MPFFNVVAPINTTKTTFNNFEIGFKFGGAEYDFSEKSISKLKDSKIFAFEMADSITYEEILEGLDEAYGNCTKKFNDFSYVEVWFDGADERLFYCLIKNKIKVFDTLEDLNNTKFPKAKESKVLKALGNIPDSYAILRLPLEVNALKTEQNAKGKDKLSNLKKDFDNLLKCLIDSSVNLKEKDSKIQLFFDDYSPFNYLGMDNDWRDNFEYSDCSFGDINFSNEIFKYTFIGKHLYIIFNVPSLDEDLTKFAILIYGFMGWFSEDVSLKIYQPKGTSVVFNAEDTVILGSTSEVLKFDEWNLKRKKYLKSEIIY